MSQQSFTILDAQTREMALSITQFKDDSLFNSLRKYNYFSMLLISKGKGSVQRDMTRYAFNTDCLLCFAIYQPFMVLPEKELEGVLISQPVSGSFIKKELKNKAACFMTG